MRASADVSSYLAEFVLSDERYCFQQAMSAHVIVIYATLAKVHHFIVVNVYAQRRVSRVESSDVVERFVIIQRQTSGRSSNDE